MSKAIALTESQKRVLDSLKAFTDSPRRMFLLKGYAGTGKTTLMRFFIRYLIEKKRSFELLAPTGRAAKVLSDMVLDSRFESQSTMLGQTIHSLIYKYKGFNRPVSEAELKSSNAVGQLSLCFEAVVPEYDEHSKPKIYIVDEASMISDTPTQGASQALFGTGRLLTELMAYDTRAESKYLFVGDPCQLPPVGSVVSPALDEEWYHPKAMSATLTEIMRQEGGNDLVRVSMQIRKMEALAPDDERYYGGRKNWLKLPLRHSPNIVLHRTVDEMVAHYEKGVKENGYDHSVFICHSNKSNNLIAEQVRRSLGFGGQLPQKGELLLVIQNSITTGLVNGDMVEVVNVSDLTKERGGLTFVEVRVKECVSGRIFSTLLLADTLWSAQLNLSQIQQTNLFVNFFLRMKGLGIEQGSMAFNDKLRTDPYLNALRCTYGYAVTCHKAQSGEWDDVYLHLPRNIGLNPTKQTYRWLYTAITRARQRLHIVDDYLYLQ